MLTGPITANPADNQSGATTPLLQSNVDNSSVLAYGTNNPSDEDKSAQRNDVNAKIKIDNPNLGANPGGYHSLPDEHKEPVASDDNKIKAIFKLSSYKARDVFIAIFSVGSGYSLSLLNAAQIKLLLRSAGVNVSPALGFTLLPLVTFMNATPLNYRENRHAFSLEQKQQTEDGRENQETGEITFRDLLNDHPFELSITLLAASADCLITVSCVEDLTGNTNNATTALAWLLGALSAGQYITLEGKELIRRMRLGCAYEDKDYEKFLSEASKLRYTGVVTLTNLLPALGALGFTALSFTECKQILGKLFTNVEGRVLGSDWATILSAALSLIYGGMHYALFGYLLKKNIADYFVGDKSFFHFFSPIENISKIKKRVLQVLAMLGSVSEGALVAAAITEADNVIFGNNRSAIPMAILFGLVGIIQNLTVEGREFLALGYGEPEEKLAEERGTSGYQIRNFFDDLLQIGTLYLSRQLVEILIIPNSASPRDEDKEETWGTYGFSSLICLLVFALQELYDLRRQVAENRYMPVNHVEMSAIGERRENNSNYLKNRWYAAPRVAKYPHYARILSQFLFQAVIPVVSGYYIEWGLRQRFQADSDNPASALSSAQLVAPIFAGLLTVGAKRLINFGFRQGFRCRKTEDPEKGVYMGAYKPNEIKKLLEKYGSDFQIEKVINCEPEMKEEKNEIDYLNEKKFIADVKDAIKDGLGRNEKTFIPISIAPGYWALIWINSYGKKDEKKAIFCLDPTNSFLLHQLERFFISDAGYGQGQNAVKFYRTQPHYYVDPIDSGAWIVEIANYIATHKKEPSTQNNLLLDLLEVRKKHARLLAEPPQQQQSNPPAPVEPGGAVQPRSNMCVRIMSYFLRPSQPVNKEDDDGSRVSIRNRDIFGFPPPLPNSPLRGGKQL